MAILRITSHTQGLRLKLELAKAALGPAVALAIMDSGAHVAQALSSAAPVGKGVTSGQLAESFHNQPLASNAEYAATQVVTTQPRVLGYVRRGTGVYGPSGQPIRPRVKRALSWEGAHHPVRSVRGAPANDFVTPVLDEGAQYARARLQAAIGETLDLLRV